MKRKGFKEFLEDDPSLIRKIGWDDIKDDDAMNTESCSTTGSSTGSSTEDTVSRQAVLDAIFDSKNFKNTFDRGFFIDRIRDLPSAENTDWIPVNHKLPEEDGDYLVTYEEGYAEDYGFSLVGICGFDVDCGTFGYWHEYFDHYTLGSLGSDWEDIPVVAWMPLPEPYKDGGE